MAIPTFVNLKNADGSPCDSNPDSSNTACEIVASDADSDSAGFTFVQAVTQDPLSSPRPPRATQWAWTLTTSTRPSNSLALSR